MKYITHAMIKELQIKDTEWVEWVDYVLKNKKTYTMPPKTSLHFGDSYFNTMPCLMPDEGFMGVKVVDRYIGRTPSLDSQILLYDYHTGENLAFMDASLITAMRTGAATTHAIKLFAGEGSLCIGIMGFGNVGLACMKTTFACFADRELTVKLLRYKDHAEKAVDRFKQYKNITFRIVDTAKELIEDSDVVISAITYTDQLIGKEEWFKEGVLVIPVHLRGFQNCDLFFDKVYGDDYRQVKGFQYFDRFRFFAETSEVVRGERPGRESGKERILVYNVGMALHDIYAASKIYKFFLKEEDMAAMSPAQRYWM